MEKYLRACNWLVFSRTLDSIQLRPHMFASCCFISIRKGRDRVGGAAAGRGAATSGKEHCDVRGQAPQELGPGTSLRAHPQLNLVPRLFRLLAPETGRLESLGMRLPAALAMSAVDFSAALL